MFQLWCTVKSFFSVQRAVGRCAVTVRIQTRRSPPPSSRGPGGNPASSSPRLRCLSWSGASSSSVTCRPRRESTWPAPWNSPPLKSRSGSRTGGINVRGSGRTRLWRWQVITIITTIHHRRPGGLLCRCWSGTEGLVWLDPRTITHPTQSELQTRTATTAIQPTATTTRCILTVTLVLILLYLLCRPATPLLMHLWTWIWETLVHRLKAKRPKDQSSHPAKELCRASEHGSAVFTHRWESFLWDVWTNSSMPTWSAKAMKAQVQTLQRVTEGVGHCEGLWGNRNSLAEIQTPYLMRIFPGATMFRKRIKTAVGYWIVVD